MSPKLNGVTQTESKKDSSDAKENLWYVSLVCVCVLLFFFYPFISSTSHRLVLRI